jgi:chemotaxis family two-component system sensor kinase Cph1
MNRPGPQRAETEIARLREALDAETHRRLDVQRLLEGMNAEFEDFISLAAHNLRESLREVASYGQLLTEECARLLDADAGVYLGRIRESTASMQSLLSDVVDYWAVGDYPSSPTAMESVFSQAILLTDAQIVKAGGIVTHDALPVVPGDFGMLVRVLHHLIRNAIQYCQAPIPRVHISCRRDDRNWLFCVQDNGPGVEPAFQERIFDAFHRLHGRENQGNGLGLAYCRKVVERLGGRMSMKSTPGAGSVFYFTVPAAD